MHRPLRILIAAVILFSALPVQRAGALGGIPENALPSFAAASAQTLLSDAQPQQAFPSDAAPAPEVSSDAVPTLPSDAAVPEETDAGTAQRTAAETAFSFTSYRGTGMFQAGSMEGPQSLPAQAKQPSLFLLRSSRAADPEAMLYNDIVSAMHSQTPQSVSVGKKTIFAIPVNVPAGAYPLPEGDQRAATASMDAVYFVYARAVNDHPDFFYYIPDVEFASTIGSDAHIAILYMRVNEAAYEEKEKYEAEKDAMCADAFPQGTQGLSKTEIALALHDYLALHLSYHTLAASAASYAGVYDLYPDAFSAYGAIVDKLAVCHGLSLAYKSLLADFGIESRVVADYTIGHAWNLLCLEDERWYHADLTHALGGMFAPEGQVLHDSFLLSDTEIESALSASRDNWLGSLPAASQKHPQRAFWTGISSAMYPVGGQWYFIYGESDAGTLQRSAFGAKRTAKTLYKNVSSVSRIGDKLYFYDTGDHSIYAYSPALNLRTLRATVETGLGEALSTGALQTGTALAADEIRYALSNGNPRSFYAGDDLGDVDGNGVCDVRDVVCAMKTIYGISYVYASELPRADVVWDSCVNEDDVRRIAEMAVGLAA